ncbi:S24 family peptidase [uncultured Reyranella sp.]|jgi:phage repressor protein C with HTH and peptisase S24 domain|uniref:S24 family peptidase n=1 Tax=uncultured Reyranella sp. TaxID=735512 RepID=UPI00259CFA49|nr:S24 family peptidase [uncultured Reyranella sp.]
MLAAISSTAGAGRASGVSLILPPDHDLVQVKGSIMAPTLLPGAWVLVDRGTRQVIGEGVYLVHDGVAEACRRISPGSACGVWAVYSDNTSYSRREDPASRIDVRGRVVGVFREV